MEHELTLALAACASRLGGLKRVSELNRTDGKAAYLLSDPNGASFVLKVAKGAYKDMLTSDWQSLVTLKSLAHGSTPTPIMYGDEGEFSWMLREYVAGHTLEEWVEAKGDVPVKQARAVAIELVSLVSRVHDAGLICRDIKPENLVRTSDGRWLLIDAETIRKHVPGKARDTVLYATAGFAAPEQYGFGQTDKRADIYALGVTLCYLFTGSTDLTYVKYAPPGVRRVIRRCTAFSPEKRYPDANSVLRALRSRGTKVALWAAAIVSVAAICAFATVLTGEKMPLGGDNPPVVRDYKSLASMINAIDGDSESTILIDGLIEMPDNIIMHGKKLTLAGKGELINVHPEKSAFRVLDGSELTLSDGVTVRSDGEGACVSVSGGVFRLRGGRLIRNPKSTAYSINSVLMIYDGSQAELADGQILIRRDEGDAIGVQIGSMSKVTISGGRVDVMANSGTGVLVGSESELDITNGMISVVARLGTGYAVNNMDTAKVSITGGEMLVNGLYSQPLQSVNTYVSNYDELIAAINSSMTGAQLIVRGEIRVPNFIRIQGSRAVTIVGQDDNSRLVGTGEGLFLIDKGNKLSMREIALSGYAGIVNWGELSAYGIDLRLGDTHGFIDNYGYAEMLYQNSAELKRGYYLDNKPGASANINCDMTVSGESAIINQGYLKMVKGSIDQTNPEGAFIDNSGEGVVERESTVFKRNGVAVEG